jgi:hypothetical protein
MIFKNIQLLTKDSILIISVFLVSTFYSSILTAYSAIVMTKTSSQLFNFFLNKNQSILKIYILAVFVINLTSLLLFIFLGFSYLYFIQNYTNGFFYYLFLALSFPFIFLIFLLIRGASVNIHKISNLLFYALITCFLLPQLIERTIS